MAECQNFFDDRSPSVCKSSSSSEAQSSPHASATMEANTEGDDQHLDLRLGLFMDIIKPKQHEMVRPIPIYPTLDKQRSPNYTSATGSSPLFRGHSDVSLAEKALSSRESAFSTPPLVSREQVWQSLQHTNALLGHASCSAKAVNGDALPSLAGRRSTSMQVMMPTHDLSEGSACPIRRSCSNGVNKGQLLHQSSIDQEALIDESPDPTYTGMFRNPEDAVELQKRKETQAHRRLEARKRRRLLIDKQQKRARQNSGGLSSRPSISIGEKASLFRVRSMDCKYELKLLHEAMAAKNADEEDVRNSRQVKSKDMRKTLSPPFCKDSIWEESCAANEVGVAKSKASHIECESGSRYKLGGLSSVQQMIASCDLSAADESKEDHQFRPSGIDAHMFEAVKVPHSSCSETESSDTKEKEVSERESSSQKSTTENCRDYGVSATVTPMSKPLPYPHTIPRVPSSATKVQLNASLPCSPLYPSTISSRNEGFHRRRVALAPGKSSLFSSEVTSNFSIKRSVGVFSEGKWRIPDEDFTSPPVRRTTSNISEWLPEPHSPPKKLETYASLSASQRKFARMMVNDTAGENEEKDGDGLQLGSSDKLHPFDKVVKRECDLVAPDEKPLIGVKYPTKPGVSIAPHLISLPPVKVKQEQDVIDDILSKNFYRGEPVQAAPKIEAGGPIKRQLSASFSDLPRVTTTGRGPNGRTINGVMYISSGRSVRLVCRCHGKHMSPAEFVEHAGSNDLSNPLRNIVVNPFPLMNQLATTPV